MGAPSPAVEVEHLTKWYGARRAVDDVSFAVAPGDVVAVLGPNGSGKSTLLRCLIGVLTPTAGRIRVGGVAMEDRTPPTRRRLGYVPEQVMLYPELTVRRYLAFVAGMKGLAGASRRRAVDDIVARCGLGDVATARTGTLSKGYRQRVGLAQALLADPVLLVLDEPTIGLDPLQTVELRDLVRGLAGCTVLLSTHVLSEAATLATRVMILKEGRLVAVDTPAELARRVARAATLTVQVEGPPADVRACLAALAGVERIDAGPDEGLRLRGADLVPVQRAVAAAVVARGWTLLGMRVEGPTLEELFVELVAG